MAFEQPILDITRTAAADLSAKQFYAVKVDANGKAALAGAGELAIGVLQNKPAAGEAAAVRMYGVTKMVAGAAVAAGKPVAVDAAGKAKEAVLGKTDTSDAGAAADPLIGSHVIGIALDAAAADGNVISVALVHLGALPTTAA